VLLGKTNPKHQPIAAIWPSRRYRRFPGISKQAAIVKCAASMGMISFDWRPVKISYYFISYLGCFIAYCRVWSIQTSYFMLGWTLRNHYAWLKFLRKHFFLNVETLRHIMFVYVASDENMTNKMTRNHFFSHLFPDWTPVTTPSSRAWYCTNHSREILNHPVPIFSEFWKVWAWHLLARTMKELQLIWVQLQLIWVWFFECPLGFDSM